MTLAVDPQTLDGAGAAVVSTGADIGSTLSRLTATLSGSAGMCGDDPVGAAMGRSYDRAAQSLLAAMTAARNGLTNIGDGVRVSAYNYSRANASSDVSGRSAPLPVPTGSGRLTAGTLPSAVGSGDDAPAGWGWVHKYIGMIWPNGDPATLRTAAAAWTAAGTALLNTELAVAAPMGIVGEQQIPEADAMGRAFGDSVRGAGQVLASCAQLSTSLNGYATHVETTQAAIIDLLARICDPMTGIKLIWDFLTSEDEDEIAAIAADIKTVVANFEAETSALAAQLAPVIAEAATTVTEMGRWADREWRHFLEDTVAGQELNGVGQTVKGFGGQAVDLLKDSWKYSPQRATVDPDGSLRDYQALVEGMAPLVGLGGDDAPGVGESWLKVGKETVHWDLWEKNPGEALGRSLFDAATFFVPGGGLTKLGKVGTGTAHAAEDAAAAAPRAFDAAARAVEAPKPGIPHIEPRSAPPPVGGPDHHGPTGSRPITAEPPTPNQSTIPGDTASNARIYSLMDETSHPTAFAPEQLLDNQQVLNALDRHGISKTDFVDLIQQPTDSLTPTQRDLINAVRDDLPAPTADTVMQKVIPPGYFDASGKFAPSRADDYLMGNNGIDVDRVGGAVTVADHTAHLGTPRQLHDGLRLDYPDTPFAPHDPGTHVIRFQADPKDPGAYDVPRNSVMGGDARYDTWDDPFTGNGFTKSGDDVVPEYVADRVTMREGAEMWEVLDDGTQRLVAVLKGRQWIPQGN